MGWATIVNGVLTHTSKADQDRVAALFEKEIELWKLQTFDTFTLSIAIRGAPDASKVYDHGQFLGYDTYSIEVWGREADVVRVELDKNGKVQIKTPGRWLSVAAYMDTKPLPEVVRWSVTPGKLSDDGKQSMWDRQWDWWQNRSKTLHKHFDFPRLPAELRETIYSHAYDVTIRPYRISKCFPFAARSPFAIPIQSTSLLLLNRLYYKEASHVLFKCATFKVNTRQVLQRLTCNDLVGSRITKIELSLSHEDFLKLFRFKGDPKFCSHPPKTALALRYMVNLANLTIDIDAPVRTSVSSPSFPTGRRVGCQDKAVDYILGAAAPFINVIKNVKVTGYAKTKVKKDFEAFCTAERKFYESWCNLAEFNNCVEEYDQWMEDDGGVSLDAQGDGDADGKEDVGGDDAEESEWPPVCSCETSCEYGSWKAE